MVTDVAALTEDVADAQIQAPCPGSVPASELLVNHTVAMLTYGLPGFAVDPTGALHLSLMRSCTGWPSGVWIDPPKRTLPDGASFQLQHWTHEFNYAVTSGDGDWRALTLPAQGQEFNHPLYGRVVENHPGTKPATHSYLGVEPAREVLIGTLKPTGNPIAHGAAASSDPADAVSLRLLESTGLGRSATLTGALALSDKHQADLLERRGAPLADSIELAGSQVTTVVGVPAAAPRSEEPLGPEVEIAQPVHSRYWLHNRGPAPMGYLPVSVGVSPGLLRTVSEPVEVSVVLASHLRDAAVEGTVNVLVPQGWTASLGSRPYRLDPDGQLRFDVTVTPPAGVESGLYFITARTEHLGQTIEDVATVAVGELPALLPVPGDIPEDADAMQGTTAETGRDTGLTVDVTTTSVTVAPGGRATVGVSLHNRTRGEIRAELQLVSPWGTWDAIAEPIRGVALAAGESDTITFDVVPPRDADPGRFWALVKVMWFGRCQYAPTVELVLEP